MGKYAMVIVWDGDDADQAWEQVVEALRDGNDDKAVFVGDLWAVSEQEEYSSAGLIAERPQEESGPELLDTRGAEFMTPKELLLAKMRKAGVAKAVANYDGSGDEGFITEVLLFDSAGMSMMDVDPVGEFPGLDKDVTEYAYQAIDEAGFPGWENNEGATGSVYIFAQDGHDDLTGEVVARPAGTVHVHHGYRVEHLEWEDKSL